MTALSITSKPRLAAKARLKWDAVRNQPLLLFPEGMLVLNSSAQEVLALCDGHRTIGEITMSLRAKFASAASSASASSSSETIDSDVRELLLRLAGKGLVVLSD